MPRLTKLRVPSFHSALSDSTGFTIPAFTTRIPNVARASTWVDFHRDTSELCFFDFVLAGHRWLWLPSYEVGHTIVNYATLIFIISLITGLVLWWPKNKAAAKQRFRFKWKPGTKWRRKNYDVHNVLDSMPP